jgi:hypothetical protein
MSQQLEVVKFRDVIPVLSIPRFVQGLEIPTLEVKGEDFRNVGQVFINEVSSPEFIIVSRGVMYVQVPTSVASIRTIEVISTDFTSTSQASKLQFEIGDKTSTASGITKLMQLFVKWLLQSPGSDIFNPERGGGLLELVGQVGTSRKMGPVISTVSRSIQNTVSQIRSAQVNVSGLPLSERLLSADLVDFDIFESQMEVRARVSLVSLAGQGAAASLAL